MSRDGRLLNREEEDESFEDGGVELGYARIPGEDGLSGNEERTRSSEEREEGLPPRRRRSRARIRPDPRRGRPGGRIFFPNRRAVVARRGGEERRPDRPGGTARRIEDKPSSSPVPFRWPAFLSGKFGRPPASGRIRRSAAGRGVSGVPRSARRPDGACGWFLPARGRRVAVRTLDFRGPEVPAVHGRRPSGRGSEALADAAERAAVDRLRPGRLRSTSVRGRAGCRAGRPPSEIRPRSRPDRSLRAIREMTGLGSRLRRTTVIDRE